MKKPKATAMTCLVLALGGLTTGCDLAFLKEVIRNGLVTGLEEEAARIPGLIIDEITDALGLPDTESDESS